MIPNISKLYKKKINIISNYPLFEQKTFITGVGKVEIGKNCKLGFKLGGGNYKGSIEIQSRLKDSLIKIGNNVSTNNNIFICSRNYIEIGDKTLIGNSVTIIDSEAHGIHPDKRGESGKTGEVIIGKNVWIGNNVIILKNSFIGENSIVAAGAIVSGKFPKNVIIGGIPAKIIKNIDV